MSNRRFDVTVLQILASVLAAVTGAIAVSYFGVTGTIIGTAAMSVASTAGSAVYKHYLGRTARRLRATAPVVAAQRAAERMSAGTHPGTRPFRTRAPGQAAAGDAGPVAGGPPPGAGERRAERGGLARWAAWLRGWPGWAKVAAASAAIFVVVVGGITVFEVAAGKPLDAVVWHHAGSGTTVGNLVGGQPSRSTAPTGHPTPSGQASSSPSPTASSPGPSPSPSSGSPSPTPTVSPSFSTPTPSASATK